MFILLHNNSESYSPTNPLYKSTLYALISIPPLILFYLLYIYGVNFPYGWDDYAVMKVIINIENATLLDKLKLFFSPHGEHIIAYVHFITWLTYEVTGHVNFKLMMVIGNLGLVIWAMQHIYIIVHRTKNIIYALPITFLIFQLQLNRNFFWGLGALANHGILAWISLCIYFASTANNRLRFILFIIFGILASFTGSGGLPAFVIGILILIYKRNYWNASLASILFLGCILIYIRNYQIVFWDHPERQYFSNLLGQSLSFFVVLGNIFDMATYYDNLRMVICGIVIFVLFLFLIVEIFYIKNLKFESELERNTKKLPFSITQPNGEIIIFYVGCILYSFTVAVILALARFHFYNSTDDVFGVPILLANYHFLSIMILLSLYGILLIILPKVGKVCAIFTFFVGAIFINLFSLPKLLTIIYTNSAQATIDYNNTFQNNYPGKGWYYFATKNVMGAANESNYYAVPNNIKHSGEVVVKSNKVLPVDTIYHYQDQMVAHFSHTYLNFFEPQNKIIAEIYSEKSKIHLCVSPNIASKKYMLRGIFSKEGIYVIIPNELLYTNQIYRLRLIEYKQNKQYLYDTDAQIDLKGKRIGQQ